MGKRSILIAIRDRIAAVVIATTAVALLTVPASADGAGAGVWASLKPGESIFSPAEYVEGSWSKEFKVVTTDGGGRLRVGLDVLMDYRADGAPHTEADQRRNFKLQIIAPSGKSRQQEVGPGYSAEVYVCFNGEECKNVAFACSPSVACQANEENGDPIYDCDLARCYNPYGLTYDGDSGGTWTVRVTGEDIDSWSYSLRAMLERQPNPGQVPQMDAPLYPNLRARPPFELTLDCKPTMGYGAFVRRGSCGSDPLAQSVATAPGCTPHEVTEAPDVRWCLRFSGGNENAGEGGFEIVAAEPMTAEDGKVYATARQVIRTRDETEVVRRDAGRLVFEDSHGHWHYDGFMFYELFAVDRSVSRPSLRELTEGIKRGWCPADEFISDWDSFTQAPHKTGPATDLGGCFLASPNAVFGQSAGWGDIYEWPREEQFVPFPVDATGRPQAGEYVVRETIDAAGLIAESDDRDNAAYAHFRVAEDGSISILERGYGTDPWDPHRRTT